MDPELTIFDTLTKLGIALGLGLLVGLQRERTDSRLAGIRTFPLITLLGTVNGLLALSFGGWILAAGMISLAAMVVVSNTRPSRAVSDPGITSEIAMFLMFGVGAYLVAGHALVAVVLAGSMMVLLHLKPQMHAWVQKMGDKDFKAIVQFVLISLVILPVLPNEAYGPYHVLNPYKIWLLVVLTVGISLGGYVAYKFFGARGGSVIAGVLGGLVSSTATTVSYARQARATPQNSAMSALVIMIASTIVFARVLAMMGIVAPALFLGISGPIAAMLLITIIIAASMWLFTRKNSVVLTEPENPTELKPAVIFGLVFALVLLGVAAAKARFGAQGLYAVALLSGLSDMDAITLSILEMAKGKQIETGVAWRMILVAAMSNFVFKALLIAVVGRGKLLSRIALPFSLALGSGGLLLWLWPF